MRWQVAGKSGILTCSALRKSYRDILCDRSTIHFTYSDSSAPMDNSLIIATETLSGNDKQIKTLPAQERHHINHVISETTILGAQCHQAAQKFGQLSVTLKTDKQNLLPEDVPPSVLFVYLKGSKQILEERLNKRKGHFMSPSLLSSQLQYLEEPTSEENHIVIDVDQPPNAIVKLIIEAIT